jgi:chaperonin cofactor prefoldin
LERDEFYIALRLIALAQNGYEVSEESIRLNHPLPPLPKFDLKSSNNPTVEFNFNPNSQEDTYTMNEEETKKYFALFNKNKDMSDRISMGKLYNMLATVKVPQDVGQKVLCLIPLSENSSMNFNEFKVLFHIIFKFFTSNTVPTTLPPSLKAILSEKKATGNEMDFGFAMGGPSSNRGSLGFTGSSSGNVTGNLGGIGNLNPGVNTNLIPSTNMNLNTNMNPNLSTNLNPTNVTTNINPNNISTNNPMISNMDINVSKAPQINNNNNLNTNFNITGVNNSQTNQNLSKSDIENSLNDFNLSTIPKKEMNAGEFNNARNNINDKFNNIYTQSIQENQFLQKTLEDDTNLLNELMSDIERINKNIQTMNDKNKTLREQILEIRKRINQEKDNLVKTTMTLNQKTTELIQTSGKRFLTFR